MPDELDELEREIAYNRILLDKMRAANAELDFTLDVIQREVAKLRRRVECLVVDKLGLTGQSASRTIQDGTAQDRS